MHVHGDSQFGLFVFARGINPQVEKVQQLDYMTIGLHKPQDY